MRRAESRQNRLRLVPSPWPDNPTSTDGPIDRKAIASRISAPDSPVPCLDESPAENAERRPVRYSLRNDEHKMQDPEPRAETLHRAVDIQKRCARPSASRLETGAPEHGSNIQLVRISVSQAIPRSRRHTRLTSPDMRGALTLKRRSEKPEMLLQPKCRTCVEVSPLRRSTGPTAELNVVHAPPRLLRILSKDNPHRLTSGPWTAISPYWGGTIRLPRILANCVVRLVSDSRPSFVVSREALSPRTATAPPSLSLPLLSGGQSHIASECPGSRTLLLIQSFREHQSFRPVQNRRGPLEFPHHGTDARRLSL